MIHFTREQKGRAFDGAPKDVKAIISNNTLADIYRKIGSQHKLNISEQGTLSEIILLTMIGLISRENFIKSIIEELPTTNEKAVELAKTINTEIFSKIRDLVLTPQEAINPQFNQEKLSKNSSQFDISISKDQILSEIENPTPVRQPVQTTGNSPAEFAHDFINTKLTAPVSLPSQKTNTELQKPAPKPVSYSTDPYREPLN